MLLVMAANFGLDARRSGPLSREGSLSCHTYCDTGPRFIVGLIRKTGTHVPQWDSNPRRKDHQIIAPDTLTTAPCKLSEYQAVMKLTKLIQNLDTGLQGRQSVVLSK
jgi:hypothetical protein